jgi:hypothetical protein
VAPPTDPNMFYDTRRQLDRFAVLWPDDVERAVALLVGSGATGDHGRLGAALAPSVDRFYGLDTDDQNVFRDALNRFVRIPKPSTQIHRRVKLSTPPPAPPSQLRLLDALRPQTPQTH